MDQTGTQTQHMNMREFILKETDEAVNGDRNASYGDPTQDFQRTATFWNTYLQGVAARKTRDWNLNEDQSAVIDDLLTVLVDTWDVAWMMNLLKCSRSTVSPGNLDHYVDNAGYAACGGECAELGGAPG